MTDTVRETKLVSLIFPAYDEIEHVEGMLEFYREIKSTFRDLDFEMLVVDDGSSDGTGEAILAGTVPGESVSVLTLSRNWGSHAGITAGLEHCSGDAAITLSADLQEPLSAIADFLAKWREGNEIVWGLRSVRAAKKGANDLLSTTFSHVLNTNSVIPTYPKEGPSQILVSRQVIEVIRAMPEANRNVLGMIAWTGFSQTHIFFEQMPRPHGASKWTRKKKIKLVMDSFVEFSSAPLQWLGLGGVILASLGGLALLAAIVLMIFGKGIPGGLTLLGGLIGLVGGALLIGLQTVGEYVWRAGDDSRRRPVYILSSRRYSADLGAEAKES
ncbi:family 2 glycosyl transferase [Arthrobacter alpinus]|uniref:Family 2 glycosyl transferase n=1 Tax=Arthrobacter alpinus TaxID=656366 RepID=A0A0M3UGF9_9MICC|nr:glycosyltransferase [Arthrobacter alpinus]ALE92679.1 family 2 glycosyl transferase [Arthrobacter alpinus]